MAPLSANMMGASSVGEGKQEGSGLDKMLKMLGSFTVLRLTSLLGAGHVEVTKEQLLDLNEKLNKVEKKVDCLVKDKINFRILNGVSFFKVDPLSRTLEKKGG